MTINSAKYKGCVIGISAVSGGGKTALTLRLADMLQDAAGVLFDDYEDSSVMPESFQAWFDDGADYAAFVMPLFTQHIRSLKDGKAVTSPVSGSKIGPAKYIVVDAPFGRVHSDSGKYFDFMIFIDTPLDIAMARRLTRDLGLANVENATDTVANVKAEAEAYLTGARRLYTSFVERVKPTCDLVLDGSLSLDELASAVVSGLNLR